VAAEPAAEGLRLLRVRAAAEREDLPLLLAAAGGDRLE
jgi:hypothetical protein